MAPKSDKKRASKPARSESPDAVAHKQVKVEPKEEEDFEQVLASVETAASGSAPVSGSAEASGSVSKSTKIRTDKFLHRPKITERELAACRTNHWCQRLPSFMKNRKTQEVQLSNTEFERLNQYRIDIGQEPIDDPIPNTDKKYTDARQLENSRLKDKMLAERVAKAKAKETTEAREAREAKEAEEIREVEEIKKAREAREAEEALRKKNKKTTEEVKVKKEKMSDDEDLYGGN